MNPARGPPGHRFLYTSWLVLTERRVSERCRPWPNPWEGSPVGLGPPGARGVCTPGARGVSSHHREASSCTHRVLQVAEAGLPLSDEVGFIELI